MILDKTQDVKALMITICEKFLSWTTQSWDLLYYTFCPSFLDMLSQTKRMGRFISFKDEGKFQFWEGAVGAWV